MHYFLDQRQCFKNLYSYQGHLKKFPVTKKKKKKKLEREENVNINYEIFKYQKHYFKVKIIRRKEKKSPYFLL